MNEFLTTATLIGIAHSGVRLATPARPSSRLARYRVELIVEARALVPAEDCE